MRLLEEFWYSHIAPAEYDTNPGKEHTEAFQRMVRSEEKLLSDLAGEQKDLLSRYADCVREFQTLAKCLLFQSSFKLGHK